MPFWNRHKDEAPQQPPVEPEQEAESETGQPSDTEQYGLQVYVEGGSDPVVDIVFVHGLTGGRESTWTEKKSDVFWPCKWLPETIPDARILGFGYDADVTHFWAQPSHNRVANHAANLVQELAMLRRKTKTTNRPIIFVAHSLGGLVCEDALLVSQVSAEKHHQNIAEHTRAYAFMGTPHHGSDLAKWGSALAGFTSLAKHANKKIVQVLKPDSETLARIEQDFHSTVRTRAKAETTTIQITCFFEELEVRGVGFIVPQHSATLPGYTPVSIHGDHMGMTKFASKDSNGYKKVTDELWRWVDDLKEEASEGSSQTMQAQARSQHEPQSQRLLTYGDSDSGPSVRNEYNTFSGNYTGSNLFVGNHMNGNVQFH